MKPLRFSILASAVWCVLLALVTFQTQGGESPTELVFTFLLTLAVTVVIFFPLTYFALRNLAGSSRMTRQAWTLDLDGASHTVELEHGDPSGRRVIRLDGTLIHESHGSRQPFDSESEHRFAIGGHECVVEIKPNRRPLGLTFAYDLVVDGVSRRSGGVAQPRPRQRAALGDLERAEARIRGAWIAGSISGIIALVVTLVSLVGSPLDLGLLLWSLVDVGIIFGLTYGISRKSRVSAILLFVYFALTKLLTYDPANTNLVNVLVALAFAYYFAMGIVGAFARHRLVRAR